MKTLDFELNKEGKRRYEICYQALAAARQVPADKWDDLVALLKKLKSLGSPDKNGLYDLAKDGEVVLERSEFNLLLNQVMQPIWLGGALPDVVDVRDWLKGIPDGN